MKTIYWVDSSKEEIRSFPEEVRRKAGHELNRVVGFQIGGPERNQRVRS